MLQKGFYHRNVNFQSHVDRKHQEFTSGAAACVDPPHLRMVFDEAVVNSLTAAQDSAAYDAQACRKGMGPANMGPASSAVDANAQTDSTLPLQHWGGQADAAATVDAAGADAAGIRSKPAQHQDRHLDAAAESELSSAVPAPNVHQADSAWQAVLQRSMQLARDTKWTHKGLQVRAACLNPSMCKPNACMQQCTHLSFCTCLGSDQAFDHLVARRISFHRHTCMRALHSMACTPCAPAASKGS